MSQDLPPGDRLSEHSLFAAILAVIGFIGLLCWRAFKGFALVWWRLCMRLMFSSAEVSDKIGFAFKGVLSDISPLQLPGRIRTIYRTAMQPGTSYGFITLGIIVSLAVIYFIERIMR